MLPGPVTGSRPRFSAYRAAYLDGLRGIASLAVVFAHVMGGISEDIHLPYGVPPSSSSESSETQQQKQQPSTGPTGRSPFKLPIVRLLYSGNAAVAVFFVISGHCLSQRLLRRARAGEYTALYTDLSSSVLRRAPRLLIPTLVSSFVVAIMAQLGAFEHAIPGPDVGYLLFAKRMSSWAAQLGRWRRDMWTQLLRPWPGPLEVVSTLYGYHMWTIPVEMWCSFRLFLHVLALSRVRSSVRVCLVGVSAFYHIAHARWDVFLFLVGMLNAEWQLTAAAESQPSVPSSASPCSVRLRRKLPVLVLLIGGLYLMSEAETDPHKAAPWALLNRLVPASFKGQTPDRFWNALGAPLAVYAVGELGLVRNFLESRVVQYLGRLSFGLYLVHNAIFCSLGAWMFGFESVNWTLAVLVIVVPVSIWLGQLFGRFVDEPVVRLVKRAEEYLLSGGRDERG